MTKSHVLIELDDALIADITRVRGQTPLPEMLAEMVQWANHCMKILAANPTAQRLLQQKALAEASKQCHENEE